MQRSTTLIGGIVGGFAAAATTYVFNPFEQWDVLANSLSAVSACPNEMKFAVATYATQFQNDFVHFFNLNYPAHSQEFHNLLMTFNGYQRAYDIGWNVSCQAFDAVRTMFINACIENAASSSYVKSIVIGFAAGSSLALLAQEFSLFKTEDIDNDPPPARQVNDNKKKRSSEGSARLFALQRFSSKDVTEHRAALGLKR